MDEVKIIPMKTEQYTFNIAGSNFSYLVESIEDPLRFHEKYYHLYYFRNNVTVGVMFGSVFPIYRALTVQSDEDMFNWRVGVSEVKRLLLRGIKGRKERPIEKPEALGKLIAANIHTDERLERLQVRLQIEGRNGYTPFEKAAQAHFYTQIR